MTRTSAWGCVLLVACAALLSIHALAGAPRLAAHPCQLPDVQRPVRCAVLEVPENPERPEGRRLAIHVAVVTASSAKAQADPIAVLMGGPGEEAIGAASIYVKQFAPLLVDRDLLLVDQRGAGKSAPLPCPLYSSRAPADSLRDFFPLHAIEDCKHRLQATADLTRYTFPYFANDLEQVRQALGYGPLNLFAGSYGTRAAQTFIRQYPHSVRTAYFGSVVPIDSGGPLNFARTEQMALDRTFANCEAEAACHSAFPNLRMEFRQMLQRLDSGQVKVHAPGDPNSVTLSRGRVVEWFRSKLYRPHDAAALPWIIHRAFEGDWSPVVDGILSRVSNDDDFSFGLFFSITCSEDLPFVSEDAIAAATRGTALGDYRIRQQQQACKLWPTTALPKDYRKPVATGVPTLFVTGDSDGGTPLWFTDRVAKDFSHHVTVVVHGQGHTEWNPCVARLFEQLVGSGSVDNLQASACPAIPLPPFKTQ